MVVSRAANPPSGRAVSPRAIAVVAAGFIIQMVMWGSFYTFGVFLVPLAQEFDRPRGDIALAYSMTSLIFGVGSVLAGVLVDRWGARRVVAVCCFLGMAGYGVMAVSTSIWQVYGGLGLLTGIGLTGSYVPVTTTVARWFSEKRGTALGIVIAGNAVGGLVGPVAVSHMLDLYGWRTAYLLVAAAVGVATLICVLLIDDPPGFGERLSSAGAAADHAEVVRASTAPRGGLRSHGFVLLSCVWIMHGVLGTAFLAHYLPHILDVGIPKGQGVLIFGIVGALGVLGGGFGGVLGDKFGSRRTLIIGLVVLSAVPSTLLLSTQPLAFWSVSIMFGLSWFGIGVLVPLIATQLVQAVELGRALGVLELIWALGAAVGAVILAWTFDLTASYRIGWLILLAGAVLGLGAAVALKLIREDAAGCAEETPKQVSDAKVRQLPK